ncbi:MAG: hypothetical protein CSA45_02950 [Gammaproteobacteria bacterium]|nr:MAG: hypothetical protein CSA45_02950 [Gammaproteobacteria bacterium]
MLGISVGRVRGHSMLPRIAPDSFVVAVKWPHCLPKRPGQVYYIDHPRHGHIVKTLDRIDAEGCRFRGESPDSVSSQAIGVVQHHQIIGRVIWVISADI